MHVSCGKFQNFVQLYVKKLCPEYLGQELILEGLDS